MMEALLQAGLTEWGLPTDSIPALRRFSELLLEKNRVMNLTAITEEKDVATLHLLDSVSLLTMADFSGKAVVDVGTGAGFPGMPMRLVKSDFSLTMLDSLGKRVHFLQDCCDELGLGDVRCVHARAEEFAAAERERYDFAVSRAVAELRVLAELALPLVKVGGQFLAMKSVESGEEIAAAKKAIAALGGRITNEIDYRIPGTQVTHRVVVIDKVSPTPMKYPRAFAKIKKQPL